VVGDLIVLAAGQLGRHPNCVLHLQGAAVRRQGLLPETRAGAHIRLHAQFLLRPLCQGQAVHQEPDLRGGAVVGIHR
jgi:hypothetical protein